MAKLEAGVKIIDKGLDWIHEGAFDPAKRLDLMDECGIHAQVLFPNAVGLGGQSLNQTMSNVRFLPMPVLPSWDIAACVRETERCAALGLRGINMTSDPQDCGSPDLANTAWDPLWEACADLHMPVHFHIGSSNTAMDFFGRYFWPSQHDYIKPAIGGSMLFINNARVVINTVFAGHLRSLPEAADGVGRERRGLDSVHPRDDGLRALRERPRSVCGVAEEAVRNTSRATGSPPSGSSRTAAMCSTSSTASVRTTSSSRPTSRTPRVCIRRRTRRAAVGRQRME